jgi:hypothetical protein
LKRGSTISKIAASLEKSITAIKDERSVIYKDKIKSSLQPYLLEEIKNPDELEINDEFWFQPDVMYWPSQKLMKEMITLASKAKTQYDLVF